MFIQTTNHLDHGSSTELMNWGSAVDTINNFANGDEYLTKCYMKADNKADPIMWIYVNDVAEGNVSDQTWATGQSACYSSVRSNYCFSS